MIEINEHSAYELLKDKYARVCLDYVILSSDEEYNGAETHKKAIIEAFQILNKRFASYDYCVDITPDKLRAEQSSIHELLELPPENSYIGRAKGERHFSIPDPIPYWYAFLEPPHGTPYLISDFIAFNDILFPNKDAVEVYRWNDDFSNYFDDGKEWWGTGLWTAFDKKSLVAVVIGASLTD